MKTLIIMHKHVILYLFFGVCTTIINVVAYWFCSHILGIGTMPGTIVAWIFSVAVAYVTNRLWVFESEAKGVRSILKELSYFFTCRLMTGFLDLSIMFAFVGLIHLNDLFIKMISNFIVIVLNYAASKIIIFRGSK